MIEKLGKNGNEKGLNKLLFKRNFESMGSKMDILKVQVPNRTKARIIGTKIVFKPKSNFKYLKYKFEDRTIVSNM